MSRPAADLTTPTARPLQRDGVLSQDAQGRTVLLRMADGFYYALDDVGAAIWELSDGTRTVSDVVDAVNAAFDGPADQIAADVREFIAELYDEQLLDLGS